MSETRAATFVLAVTNAIPMALLLEREAAPGSALTARLVLLALGAGLALLLGAVISFLPERAAPALASASFALAHTLTFGEERAFTIFRRHLTAELLSRATPHELISQALVSTPQVALAFCAPLVLAFVELAAFIALRRRLRGRALPVPSAALAVAGALLVTPSLLLEPPLPAPPPVRAPAPQPFWITAFPRAPLAEHPIAHKPDILWIILDSWRADGLNATDMPRTEAFAARAQRFTHAFAAGNETNLGMFSLLYSLPGPYLRAVRANLLESPLLHRLAELGYDIHLRTSTELILPPAATSAFEMPRMLAQRHPDAGAEGLARDDLRLVEDFTDDLETRDRATPHFDLVFFTATHSTYFYDAKSRVHLPDEIPGGWGMFDPRVPASMDAARNRYRNALGYSDRLVDGLLSALERKGTLDQTVVLITGDHGEEFDADAFGHANYDVHREEIEIPLVLSVPGVGPRVVERSVSQLDVAPTFLSLLGVDAPPGTAGLGVSLLGQTPSAPIRCCSEASCAVVDSSGVARIALDGSDPRLSLFRLP